MDALKKLSVNLTTSPTAGRLYANRIRAMQLIPNANDLNIFLISNGKLSSAGSDSKQPELRLDYAAPERK